MSIQAVGTNDSATRKNRVNSLISNSVKISGYASLVLGTASAVAGVKKKIKPHKYMAYLAGIFAVIHTGLVEGRRYVWKKCKKESNS